MVNIFLQKNTKTIDYSSHLAVGRWWGCSCQHSTMRAYNRGWQSSGEGSRCRDRTSSITSQCEYPQYDCMYRKKIVMHFFFQEMFLKKYFFIIQRNNYITEQPQYGCDKSNIILRNRLPIGRLRQSTNRQQEFPSHSHELKSLNVNIPLVPDCLLNKNLPTREI